MRKFFFFVTLLLCNTLIAQLPNNIPSDGLIGYWSYSGNAQDQSINNNHGNVTSALLIPDRFGNANSAYRFDGATSSIVVPYNPTQQLSTGFTFSGWVKNDITQPDFQSIFLRQGGEGATWDKTWLLLHHTGDGTSNLRVYNEHSYYTSVSLGQTDEGWYHLAVTIEGTTATVFKNGVRMGSGDIGFPLTYTPASMKFGMAGSGNQLYHYKGDLDDIGIWSRVLTEEEISGLYNPIVPECTMPLSVTIPQTKALDFTGITSNTVYPAYAPASTITLTAHISGNALNYDYQWSNGANTPSISVSPASNTTYVVKVIDRETGCEGTASVDIMVKEIGCENGKIQVCHITGSSKNPSTSICIDASGVLAHLQHGCTLGACTTTSKPPVSMISAKVFPNPTTAHFTLSLNSDDVSTNFQLRVLDNYGNVVEARNNLSPNSYIRIGSNYKPGNYFIELIQGSAKQQLKVLKSTR